MTEDEMVAWHHQLHARESEQALRDGDGQGGLACCGPWGRKESDTTERLNNNNIGLHEFIINLYLLHKHLGCLIFNNYK